MKAFIIASGVRISPFGDPVFEMPIGDETLGAIQTRLLEKFGLEVVRIDSVDDVPSDEACVVTYDDVFFTRRVLKDFLSKWNKTSTVRVALPRESTYVQKFSWQQDIAFVGDHAGYRLFGRGPEGSLDDAEMLPVIYKEKLVEVRVPHFVNDRGIWEHPVTSSICMHVGHWVHVLDLNRLSIQVKWVDEFVTRPWWGAWVAVEAALFRRGSWLWRFLGAANRFGKNVDIHPTARVEGSFIGDGAKVGAQALVRGSIIGAGAVLEERCNVAYSTIGANCFVSKYTLVYSSAVMEETNAGMSMQMCLVGKRAAVTPRATPIDIRRGGDIRVRVGDEHVAVPHDVLGSCFGHDTFIGPDVYIAPGRELPNGLTLHPPPGRVLTRIPSDLDTSRPYRVADGGLEPS